MNLKKNFKKIPKYRFCSVTWKSCNYHMITQAGNEIKKRFIKIAYAILQQQQNWCKYEQMCLNILDL